jgi:hypothetical protein
MHGKRMARDRSRVSPPGANVAWLPFQQKSGQISALRLSARLVPTELCLAFEFSAFQQNSVELKTYDANGLGSEWNWPKVDGNRSVRGYGVLGGPKSRGPDREIENARQLQVVSRFRITDRLASLYSN